MSQTKLLEKLILKILKEELEIATEDGTAATATPEQKNAAKKELDNGGSVSFKKKGDQVDEALNFDKQGKIDFLKHIGVDVDWQKVDDKLLDTLFTSFKQSKSFMPNDAKMNESEDKEAVKPEDTDKKPMIDSPKSCSEIAPQLEAMIAQLSQIGESTEDNKYKRHTENVLKHLTRAQEALQAVQQHESVIAEKKAAEEDKAANKHVDAVQKHIAKKVKDKKDVEPIMKKYQPVAKKLHFQGVKDPAKAAEAIWKHVLKEAADKL